MATVVRVDDALHQRLAEVSRREQRSIGKVIEDALGIYERERLWRETKEAYARLREDPVAWSAYKEELQEWDALSGDGIEDEEPYYTPEEEAEIARELAESEGR
jgi:hypothetical protein